MYFCKFPYSNFSVILIEYFYIIGFYNYYKYDNIVEFNRSKFPKSYNFASINLTFYQELKNEQVFKDLYVFCLHICLFLKVPVVTTIATILKFGQH